MSTFTKCWRSRLATTRSTPSMLEIVLFAGAFFWMTCCIGVAQVAKTPPAATAFHWQVTSHDCQMQLVDQQRFRSRAGNLPSDETDPSQRMTEQLRFVAGQGTRAWVACAIQPLSLIDELEIALPFLGDRPGQQVMVRVVLPRSHDARTGQPLTFHIRGDLYERPGKWQTLRLPRLSEKLDGQVRILRSQHGPNVDGREAYVDQLLINIYSGEGTSIVKLGDPIIRGAVLHGQTTLSQATANPADGQESGVVLAASTSLRTAKPADTATLQSEFRLEGDLLLVGERPFFVRAIQANGEDWSFLQQLGFNTLLLSKPVTGQQIQNAEALGLWLIAPPPTAWKGGDLGQPYRRVLVWNLGSHLTSRERESVRAQADAVRAADNVRRRPILCSPDNDLAAFDEIADILLHNREPIGSSFPLTHYRGWLTSRSAFALAGTPHWATIQTQPLSSIISQATAFGYSPAEVQETLAINAEQIESLALSSVASGIRGLVFASRTRLDTESERGRATALRAANLKLDSIEPWIAGGRIAARGIAPGRNAEVAKTAPTTVLRTARSWLVLPSADANAAYDGLARWSKSNGATALEGHRTRGYSTPKLLTVPGVPTAIDVFEFQPEGLRRLGHQRTLGGIQLEPESDASVGSEEPLNRMILLTRDPLVVKHIHQSLARRTRLAAELQRQVGLDLYARTERLLARLDRSNERLLPAANLLTTSGELFASDRYAEVQKNSAAALKIIRSVRSQVARETTVSRDEWPWSGHLEAATWQASFSDHANEHTTEQLAAGGFEDLAAMRAAGWRNWEHAPPWVTTHVELSRDRPREGDHCLRLSTAITDSTGIAERFLEKPPLWVTSPALKLPSGEKVRIRGWIRIPAEPTHCHDGALLFDSLGGPSLAVRVPADGEWQPFSVMRAVPSHESAKTELTITLALTGIGQVDLDGLSVTTLDSQ